MRHLTGLSLAHPVVSVERRAPLSFSAVSMTEAIQRLRSAGHDVFLLSTCLRIELVWPGEPEEAADILVDLYGEVGVVAELGVFRTGQDLFAHLCRISSGLASPIVGEPEILSQFRQAVSWYREGWEGRGALGFVLEAAIGIGRAVRKAHGASSSGSLGSAAAKAASGLDRVAILGSGAMARAAVEHLTNTEVSVYARRPGNVLGHQALPWEQAPNALETHPGVISTVPGGEAPIAPDRVAFALERRREPLLLIDLGMPPGFNTASTVFQGRYLGVDDIATFAAVPVPADLEQMLQEEAFEGWQRLTSPPRVGSIINAIVEQSDRAVDEEVQRFAARLHTSEDPESVLRQLAHTVARRILHSPISYVSSEAGETAEVVAAAFGIEDD